MRRRPFRKSCCKSLRNPLRFSPNVICRLAALWPPPLCQHQQPPRTPAPEPAPALAARPPPRPRPVRAVVVAAAVGLATRTRQWHCCTRRVTMSRPWRRRSRRRLSWTPRRETTARSCEVCVRARVYVWRRDGHAGRRTPVGLVLWPAGGLLGKTGEGWAWRPCPHPHPCFQAVGFLEGGILAGAQCGARATLPYLSRWLHVRLLASASPSSPRSGPHTAAQPERRRRPRRQGRPLAARQARVQRSGLRDAYRCVRTVRAARMQACMQAYWSCTSRCVTHSHKLLPRILPQCGTSFHHCTRTERMRPSHTTPRHTTRTPSPVPPHLF